MIRILAIIGFFFLFFMLSVGMGFLIFLGEGEEDELY